MDGANQPCAACKHLGKICDQTCILAPYFPIERTEEFQCVHKVFGLSNLTKIVSSVEENERATTVETLIIEAKMRLYDRVNGSLGVVKKLETEIASMEKELDSVRQQLCFFRKVRDPLAGPSNSDLKGKRKT